VLKPSGGLHLVDFVNDRLVQQMLDAGFAESSRVGDRQTIAGAIGFYRGVC